MPSNIWRRSFSLVLGFVLILAWFLHFSDFVAYGKLTVISPDKMLEEADVIFTGKIIKFEDVPFAEEDYMPLIRLIHIKVDLILKGGLDSDVVVLKEYAGGITTHQKYPDKKEKVFVLQRKSSKYGLTPVADTRNIGIIRNDRVVEVIQNNSQRDYVPYYDEYYQANKAKGIKPPSSKHATTPFIYVTVALFCIVVTLSVIIIRHRRKLV